MEVRLTVACASPLSGGRHGILILSPETCLVVFWQRAACNIRVPQLGFGSGQLLLANHVRPGSAILSLMPTHWVPKGLREDDRRVCLSAVVSGTILDVNIVRVVLFNGIIHGSNERGNPRNAVWSVRDKMSSLVFSR